MNHQLKFEEEELKQKIENLEFKNSLLSEDLDKDFIEILIREKFIFSKNGEQIYVLKKNEKSN